MCIRDSHTFDVQTLGADGSKHRLYLTAFIDARSGIFTGWHVTETPSAYAVLLALRRGILERGIPENILTDNGSDFCAWDVGGRGHRKRNAEAEANRPPTIMEHLGKMCIRDRGIWKHTCNAAGDTDVVCYRNRCVPRV